MRAGHTSVSVVLDRYGPLLASRAEHVQLEGVFERLRLVQDAAGNQQDLPFPDRDLFTTIDLKLQRALQDICHLLGVVCMPGHQTAALDIHLHQLLALTADDLPRQHFSDFFERNLVPAVECDTFPSHVATSIYQRGRML